MVPLPSSRWAPSHEGCAKGGQPEGTAAAPTFPSTPAAAAAAADAAAAAADDS